jgi:protein-S-isoprenylcysteine O-methyltransferase Ste14
MSVMFASFAALILGFAFNAASAGTSRLAARFGIRRGQMATIVLRDVLGIPLWIAGLAGTIALPAPAVFDVTRVIHYAAAGLIGAGSLVIAWALLWLRRRAAAPSVRDRLEERDLVERLPEYRVCMQRVPRFFPRPGPRSA